MINWQTFVDTNRFYKKRRYFCNIFSSTLLYREFKMFDMFVNANFKKRNYRQTLLKRFLLIVIRISISWLKVHTLHESPIERELNIFWIHACAL